MSSTTFTSISRFASRRAGRWSVAVAGAFRVTYTVLAAATIMLCLSGVWSSLRRLPPVSLALFFGQLAVTAWSAADVITRRERRRIRVLLPALSFAFLLGLALWPTPDSVGAGWWPTSAMVAIAVYGLTTAPRGLRWLPPAALTVVSSVGVVAHANSLDSARNQLAADVLQTLVIVSSAYLVYFQLTRAAAEADAGARAARRFVRSTSSPNQQAVERDAAENFVHDVVIPALRAVELSSRGLEPALVRQQARSTTDAIAGGGGTPQFTRLETVIVDTAREFGLAVTITGYATAPPHVMTAITGAIREALRNVALHAGTTSAEVRLRQLESGIRVVIEDHGVGFGDPSAIGHRGVSQSIVGRMEHVGGQARVIGRPGVGTRVILEWGPDSRSSATYEFSTLSSGADRLFTLLPVPATVAGFIGSIPVSIILHNPSFLVGATALLAIALTYALSPSTLRMTGWQALTLWFLATVTSVASVLSTSTLLPAMQDNSLTGPAACVLQLIVFARPAREFLPYCVGHSAIALTVFGVWTHSGWSLGAYLPMLYSHALAYSVAIAVWGALRAMRRSERLIAAPDPADHAPGGAAVQPPRLASVGRFLDTVATGAADPADAAVRAQAGALEAGLRDALLVHGELPDRLTRRFYELRLAGWTISHHARLNQLTACADPLVEILRRLPAQHGNLTITFNADKALVVLAHPLSDVSGLTDERWSLDAADDIARFVIASCAHAAPDNEGTLG